MSEEDQFLRVRSQPKKPLLHQIFPGLIIKIGYQRFKRLLYPNNIVTSRPFILIPHTIDSLLIIPIQQLQENPCQGYVDLFNSLIFLSIITLCSLSYSQALCNPYLMLSAPFLFLFLFLGFFWGGGGGFIKGLKVIIPF